MLKRSPVKRRRQRPRRGPLRDEGYRLFLREHGRCVACGVVDMRGNAWTRGMCDPAHTVNNGMRSKGPDSSCVPLCRRHHGQYDGHAKLPDGAVGRKAFERFYGLEMQKEAETWWQLYQMQLNVENVRRAEISKEEN